MVVEKAVKKRSRLKGKRISFARLNTNDGVPSDSGGYFNQPKVDILTLLLYLFCCLFGETKRKSHPEYLNDYFVRNLIDPSMRYVRNYSMHKTLSIGV